MESSESWGAGGQQRTCCQDPLTGKKCPWVGAPGLIQVVLEVPFPPTFFHRAQRGAGLSILQAESGRRKKGSEERDKRGRKRKSLHQ